MSAKQCPTCLGTGVVTVSTGERLRELREAHNLTQDDAAKVLGLSRTQVANVESGRSDLTPQHLVVLCRNFSVTSDWLLGLERPTARAT